MLEDLEMYIYINYKFLSENTAFDCSDKRKYPEGNPDLKEDKNRTI